MVSFQLSSACVHVVKTFAADNATNSHQCQGDHHTCDTVSPEANKALDDNLQEACQHEPRSLMHSLSWLFS